MTRRVIVVRITVGCGPIFPFPVDSPCYRECYILRTIHRVVGIVEETSCAKDGHHTACTQRPWCGALGNPGALGANFVVSVHMGYAVGDFHGVLAPGAPGSVPKSCADGPAVFINNAGDSFTVTGG